MFNPLAKIIAVSGISFVVGAAGMYFYQKNTKPKQTAKSASRKPKSKTKSKSAPRSKATSASTSA